MKITSEDKIDEMIAKYEAFDDDEFYLHFNKFASNEFGNFEEYMVYVSNRVKFPVTSKYYKIYLYFKNRITQIERDKKLEQLFWEE
jgi:hypothetical protein